MVYIREMYPSNLMKMQPDNRNGPQQESPSWPEDVSY